MNIEAGGELISVREAARECGRNMETVRRWIWAGKLAWQLAGDFNLSVCYDMQYLAVAELRDCELWTANRRLASSLRGKAQQIKWIGVFTGEAEI